MHTLKVSLQHVRHALHVTYLLLQHVSHALYVTYLSLQHVSHAIRVTYLSLQQASHALHVTYLSVSACISSCIYEFDMKLQQPNQLSNMYCKETIAERKTEKTQRNVL